MIKLEEDAFFDDEALQDCSATSSSSSSSLSSSSVVPSSSSSDDDVGGFTHQDHPVASDVILGEDEFIGSGGVGCALFCTDENQDFPDYLSENDRHNETGSDKSFVHHCSSMQLFKFLDHLTENSNNNNNNSQHSLRRFENNCTITGQRIKEEVDDEDDVITVRSSEFSSDERRLDNGRLTRKVFIRDVEISPHSGSGQVLGVGLKL